jgi:hypothetical protein
MATRYPRIGVIKDPELQAALEITRGLLDPRATGSDAGQVRQLALLGARVLDLPGVRPATRTIADLNWLAAEPVDEGRSASRALEWVRGET